MVSLVPLFTAANAKDDVDNFNKLIVAVNAILQALQLANVLNLRILSSGASTTLVLGSDYVLVVNKTVGSATTVYLPTTQLKNGTTFIIVDGKGDAATNNITINGGSYNINGSTTFVINNPYESVTLVFNGTSWSAI